MGWSYGLKIVLLMIIRIVIPHDFVIIEKVEMVDNVMMIQEVGSCCIVATNLLII